MSDPVKTEAQEALEVEAYLKEIQMTVKDFLLLAQVGTSTWARIKTGETIPNGATMWRVRSALNTVKKKVAESEQPKKTTRGKKRKA